MFLIYFFTDWILDIFLLFLGCISISVYCITNFLNLFLFFYSCLFYYSCPNFFLFALPLSSSPPAATVHPHPAVHVHGSFTHVLRLVPSPSFHHFPATSSSLAAVSLFHASKSLVLLCLLVYFVH